MTDKKYRIRRFGSSQFEEVSEQEYLDNVAKSHQLRRGERLEGPGPHIVNEPERGRDIELKPSEKRKKAAAAYRRGLSGR